MTATALIIDDEPDIRELIAMTLTRMGLDHHAACNLEEARYLLNHYAFDVCLTDMRLPDGNGVEFVRYIQSLHPSLPVAVITAHGNMQAAIDAMKNGAYDFVSKPVDINQLRRLVVQAIAVNAGNANSAGNDAIHLTDGNSTSLESLSGRDHHPSNQSATETTGAMRLLGQSEPMQQLRSMINKVGRTNAPIWITGESGTGKELIARLIHESGPRKHEPFIAINCGAIPSELMESELFGHRKGSFTGASSDHDGLFKRAEGGTLFLDEVAELPLHMQVKLLRAIQERSIRAVGANDEIAVDVRILSASHKDLGAEVEASRFRHDLYYRLNVICLRAPSLRERPEDIAELSSHILQRMPQTDPTATSLELEPDALQSLTRYSFPGNVRELENILERAVALAEGRSLSISDLRLEDNSPGTANLYNVSQPVVKNIDSVEKNRLVKALNDARWNRKAAASVLGLTYRQLRYRIQQLGIDESASPKS